MRYRTTEKEGRKALTESLPAEKPVCSKMTG